MLLMMLIVNTELVEERRFSFGLNGLPEPLPFCRGVILHRRAVMSSLRSEARVSSPSHKGCGRDRRGQKRGGGVSASGI